MSYLVTKVTDARGNGMRTFTDARGHVTDVIPLNGMDINNPLNPSLHYTYDEADHLISAARGDATTTLTYDIAGRKTQMNDADLGLWYYQYDALSNLTGQTDARSCATTLSYDLLSRLTGKTYSNCPTTSSVTYSYDAYDPANGQYGRGQRTGMSDSSGSTTWKYDLRGRMTQESKTITSSGTFVTQYGYNSADLVISMRYPENNAGGLNGEQVNFTYLPQKLLNAVSGASTYVQSTSYDAAGRADVRILGSNQLKTDYDYFPWTSQGGRLQYLKSGTPSNPTSLQSFEYSYDPGGNISWIKDYAATGGTQTQTFHYDALSRLVDAQATGGTGGTYGLDTYTYDTSRGNLASKNGMGAYTYTDGGHKHAVTSLGGVQKYWYDANGNQVTRTVGSTTYNLTYDAENRLVGSSGGVSASFGYDGDGNRVTGTVGSTTTTYIGNYCEWSGGVLTKYYYAGTTRVAVRQGSTLSWLFADHLGSTSITADSSGTRVAELRYKAWGEVRYTFGATPTTYRYTGQRAEDSLAGGLDFYGARWYDGNLGRWIQPDTLIPEASQGVQAWDRMAYVNNNPINYTDPTGHNCDACWEIARALWSATVATTSYMIQNPPKVSNLVVNIPMVLPIELGGGISNIPLDLAPLKPIGRLIGDSTLPLTIPIGLALATAPEQIENISQGAPWNDYIGDAVVDTLGFAISETAGDAAGVAIGSSNPVAGVTAKFGFDIGTGLAYDAWASKGFRNDVIDTVEDIGNLVNNWWKGPQGLPKPKPIQTPPVKPRGTPIPQ